MQAAGYKRCRRCGETKPLSDFHQDRAAADGHRWLCKPCGIAQFREWEHRSSRERYEAKAARHAQLPEVPEDFGHWLAGFIDGEGCFQIRRVPRGRYDSFQPHFSVALREDDGPLLERVRRQLEIGHVYRGIPTANPKANPQAAWHMESKSDCLRLVEILDRFPLRSKKARDYAIWREAVLLWVPMRPQTTRGGGLRYDWSRLAELRTDLMTGRAYS